MTKGVHALDMLLRRYKFLISRTTHGVSWNKLLEYRFPVSGKRSWTKTCCHAPAKIHDFLDSSKRFNVKNTPKCPFRRHRDQHCPNGASVIEFQSTLGKKKFFFKLQVSFPQRSSSYSTEVCAHRTLETQPLDFQSIGYKTWRFLTRVLFKCLKKKVFSPQGRNFHAAAVTAHYCFPRQHHSMIVKVHAP